MERRLVRYLKNPWHNFLGIIFFFSLYVINHRYFGLDFLNESLDNLFNLFPLLLLFILCLNIFFFRKEKYLLIIQSLLIFFVGLFYLIASFTWANEIKDQKIDMKAGTHVELIKTTHNRDNYLMQEEQLLFLFVKKKCLFSFSSGPSINLVKVDDDNLQLGLTLKSTTSEHEIALKDLAFFNQVYKCEDGTNSNVDPYYGVFSYWIRLLSSPFSANEFDPS